MNTSNSILCIGESGSGKSTSLRNLDPKSTIIFSTLGKGLPFKNSRLNYTVWHKEQNPNGNMIITSSAKAIAQWLGYINKSMPHVKTIIIDDATFLSAKELDRRREETGYTKFSDIAHDFLYLSEIANTLRGDINVYFMYHVTSEGDDVINPKVTKAMSAGKMISEKLASIEGQFEIVFLACKMQDSDDNLVYKFKTRDMHSTCKTPIGLFDEQYIDNDLQMINEAIDCYYSGCTEKEAKTEVKKKAETVK